MITINKGYAANLLDTGNKTLIVNSNSMYCWQNYLVLSETLSDNGPIKCNGRYVYKGQQSKLVYYNFMN